MDKQKKIRSSAGASSQAVNTGMKSRGLNEGGTGDDPPDDDSDTSNVEQMETPKEVEINDLAEMIGKLSDGLIATQKALAEMSGQMMEMKMQTGGHKKMRHRKPDSADNSIDSKDYEMLSKHSDDVIPGEHEEEDRIDLSKSIFEGRITRPSKKMKETKKRRSSIIQQFFERERRMNLYDENSDSDDSGISDEEDTDRASDRIFKNTTSDKEFTKKFGKSPSKYKVTNDVKASLEATTTQVVVTRQEKECKVRINEFTRAIKNIIDFQEIEDTKVNMMKVLSDGIKRHLKNRYALRNEQLKQLGPDQLLMLVSRETNVYNVQEFYRELKSALQHINATEWDEVDVHNFKDFYFEQLRIIEDFERILKLKLINNKLTCPKVVDKEYGLIRLFKEVGSTEFIKSILPQMEKREYNTMTDFFKEFTEILEEYYRVSILSKAIPFAKNKNFKKKLGEKEAVYYQKKREFNRQYDSSKPKYSYNSGVNNIDHFSERVNSEAVPKREDEANDSSENEMTLEVELASSDEEKSKLIDNEESEMEKEAKFLDSELANLSAMNNDGKRDLKGLPCLRKLFNGTCDNEKCGYGHKEDVMIKGALDMQTKIKNYLEKHPPKTGTDGLKDYRILQRGSYGQK